MYVYILCLNTKLICTVDRHILPFLFWMRLIVIDSPIIIIISEDI